MTGIVQEVICKVFGEVQGWVREGDVSETAHYFGCQE